MTPDRDVVLVVDDDSAFSDVVLAQLEASGVHAIYVSSVAEAFNWLDTNAAIEPLAILTDIIMPDADGLEFISGLAARGCRIPLMAMSGRGGPYLELAKALADSQNLNFIDALPKPLDYKRLLAHVAALRRQMETGGSPRQSTVLVVDDEPLSIEIARSIFETAGYRVIEAASGREALEILRAGQSVDLLFADYRMPAMNGGILAIEALRIQSALKIILTSSDRPETIGKLPFVAKPYRPEQLIKTTKSVMKTKSDDS